LPGQYNCIDLDGSTAVDLGTDIGVVIGSTPFAVEAGIYVEEGNIGSILSQDGVYDISVVYGVLTVESPGQAPVSAGPNLLMAPGWHQVAVSYDGTAVTLFVDSFTGTSTQFTFAASNANHHLAGSGFNGRIDGIAIFSVPRSQADMVGDTNAPIAQWGARRYFDFSQVPPVDDLNAPLTLPTGINSVLVTPALSTEGNGLAVSFDAGVNPGGNGNDAYTVQAWIRVIQSSPLIDSNIPQANGHQIIFSNTSVGGGGGVALYLAPVAGSSSYNAVAQRGSGSGAAIVQSTALVPLNVWTNIAMTYDPSASSLMVYVNGVASGSTSASAMPATTVSAVAIAGAFATTSPSVFSTFESFQGYTANVAIFTSALSAVQIATYQTTLPTADPTLSALFAMDGAPATNSVTGTPVGLVGDATMADSLDPATAGSLSQFAQAVSPHHAVAGKERSKELGEISAAQIAAFRAEVESRWKAIDMRRELALAMERDLAAMRQRSRAESDFERDRQVIEVAYQGASKAITAGPFHGPGDYVTYHRLDEDWIIVAHGPFRSTPVMRLSRADVTECGAWQLSMAVTILLSLLGLFFGIRAYAGDAATFYQNLRATRGAAVTALFNVLVVEGVTATAIFNIFYGLITGAIWQFLAIGASGFTLVYAIARGLAYIGLQPWGAAVLVAQVGVSLGKILAEWLQRPAGCVFD